MKELEKVISKTSDVGKERRKKKTISSYTMGGIKGQRGEDTDRSPVT
jgi:hypothetical protein